MKQNHDCKIAELIIRVIKAYLHITIFNNKIRNTLIEEQIFSVQKNSQVKYPFRGSRWGQSICGDVFRF